MKNKKALTAVAAGTNTTAIGAKTGDDNHPGIYLLLVAIAAAVLVFLLYRRRRQNNG